jgi:hypothetical protein
MMFIWMPLVYTIDQVSDSPFLPLYVCEILEKLAEGNRQHFPIKKLLMLHWILTKSLVGTDEHLKAIKVEVRENWGVGSKDPVCKVNPQEKNFHEMLMLYRYPSYCSPSWRSGHLLPLEQSEKKFFERYYDSVNQESYTLQASLDLSRHSVVVPPISNSTSVGLPKPLMESYRLHDQSFYVPSVVCRPSRDFQGSKTAGASKKFIRMARFMELLHEELQNHLAMLVRLLFYLNITGHPNEVTSIDPLDELDKHRHKEILTNLISELLLMYLKAAKRYRILILCRSSLFRTFGGCLDRKQFSNLDA